MILANDKKLRMGDCICLALEIITALIMEGKEQM